jgi:hypothetical protein
MPFSTMELDQTVEGNFVPDLAITNEPSDVDADLEQPRTILLGLYRLLASGSAVTSPMIRPLSPLSLATTSSSPRLRGCRAG